MTAVRDTLVSIVALMMALPAMARDPDLDQWFDDELVPAVNERLQNHPRFKGQSVMFVVIDDNEPAAVSNALALSLRDRLLDAALDSGSIRVAGRQGGAGYSLGDSVDCKRDTINYYVGVEVDQKLDRRYEIRVRAMDLEDGSWVGGFGSTWRGELTGLQQRALREKAVDATFTGARDVPFTVTQTDLLARHLAHELSCALSGQTSGEYILPVPGEEDPAAPLAGALDLVSRNIARHSAVSMTASPELGNAVLSAEAHPVDRALHQYWLTITPTSPGSDLAPLSVSAYVILQDGAATEPASTPTGIAVAPAPDATRAAVLSVPTTGGEPLIGPLRVMSPRDTRECRAGLRLVPTAVRWSGDERCSLLSATANADAIVFVLEHQPQLGLVRLGDAGCRDRTTARVVRSGDPLKFPIARFGSVQTRRVDEWLVNPATDTYYAVAITEARAARRLANHIDRLPMRCGSSLRPGLTGDSMRRWLDEFAVLVSRSVGAVDWRAIELKDVL